MKQSFITIVLLMSLSLLGIIFIQIFWMKNAMSVKEEQFDLLVNEALSRSVIRIERNQNAFLLSSMFSGRYISSKFQKQFYNKMGVSDSIIFDFEDYWNKKRLNSSKTTDTHGVTISKEHNNGMETISYGFDTLIVNGNSQQRIKTFSRVTTPTKVHPEKNKDLSENPSEFEMVRNELSSVMEQMVFEFSIRDFNIEDRLAFSIIEPTISYELRNMNLPLHFEFAITDANGKVYENLKTHEFNTKKSKNAYKTRLFPGDFTRTADQIRLYFPEKRAYIYSSLIWLVIGSIIFTVIILITFYYTLRTIVNQKKVSEIKTDFINNMTHEFKTPIATISLAADSISNPLISGNPDKIKRFTSIIKEENSRMNRQVESVLKMALIDKKDFNLNISEMDINPLIEKVIKNISIQIEQKGGNINFIKQAKNSVVRIDETHFVNVIYNLLDNANKYTYDKIPQIKITTQDHPGYIYISIKDNGIGMDKATQEKIFHKFYRYSTGDVHTVKGFGLGLSYVKVIILSFKGDITLKSEKGKGSTFTIKLPIKN